jgi:hypothetical protein
MTAWLLERTWNGRLQYLGAFDERLAWVSMLEHAIRFAREEDALTLRNVLNGPVFDSTRALNGTETAVKCIWDERAR